MRIIIGATLILLLTAAPAPAQVRWSGPVPLGTAFNNPTDVTSEPAAVPYDDGGVAVAWMQARGSGETRRFEFAVVRRARDGTLSDRAHAVTGQRPSAWDFAVSGAGVAALVWEQRNEEIWAALGRQDGSFSAPFKLAGGGTDDGAAGALLNRPAVAWAGPDEVVFGWTRRQFSGTGEASDITNNVRTAVVSDGQVVERQTLTTTLDQDSLRDLDLERLADGSVVGGWAGENGIAGFSIRPRHESFGAASAIGHPEHEYWKVELAASGVPSGGFIGAWHDCSSTSRSGDFRCAFETLTREGGDGGQLEPVGDRSQHFGQEADLAVAAAGRALLAFLDYENPSGPWLAERPPGGAFSQPVALSGATNPLGSVALVLPSGLAVLGSTDRNAGFRTWLKRPHEAAQPVRTTPSREVGRRPTLVQTGARSFVAVSEDPASQSAQELTTEVRLHAGVVDTKPPTLRALMAVFAEQRARVVVRLRSSEPAIARVDLHRRSRHGFVRIQRRARRVGRGRSRFVFQMPKQRRGRFRVTARLVDLAANRSRRSSVRVVSE